MSTSRSSSPDAAALASMVPVPAERDMPAGRQQALLEYLISEVSESASLGPANPRRPAGRGRRMFRPPRRALIAGTVVITSVTAIVVTLISVFSSQSALVGSPQRACAAPYRNGAVPFPGGYRTTLAQAHSVVGFPVPVPHSPPAGQHTLSGIWVSQDSQLVALLYGKGKIKILLQRWPTTANPITQSPEKWFRHEQNIMARNSASIGRVNGEPALIVRPNIGPCHTNPALVQFYRRGLEIDVSSTDYGTAELLKIAQNIH